MRLIKAAELWLDLEGAGLPVPPNLSRLEDLVPLGTDAVRHYRELALLSNGKAPSYTKIRVLTKQLRVERLALERKKNDRPLTPKELRQEVQLVAETLNLALSSGPMDEVQVKAAKAKVEKLLQLLQPPPQKPKLKKGPRSKPPDAEFEEVDLSTLKGTVSLVRVNRRLILTYPAGEEALHLALATEFTANTGWSGTTPGVLNLRLSDHPAHAHSQTAAAAQYLQELGQRLKIPPARIILQISGGSPPAG